MPFPEEAYPFTWAGEFADAALERRFRVDLFHDVVPQAQGVAAMTAAVFLLAGLGPIIGHIDRETAFLLALFRVVPSLGGFAIALWGRSLRSAERLSWVIALYTLGVGIYEAVELTILFQPGLEYTVPFTLLIVFVAYLLFGALLMPIMGAALIVSVTYLLALGMAVPAEAAGVVYTLLFFVLANAAGIFVCIRMSCWRRRHFAALRSIRQLNSRLTHDNRAKEITNRVLSDLAETDALTGVTNRRGLTRRFEQLEGDKRSGGGVALLLLDLDRFKRINDTHGHDAGDAALIAVTRQIQGVLRREDLLARIGGEEFAALLPDTNSAGAMTIAERIRRLVEETPVSAEDQEIRTTVSIGIAARLPEARREVGLNTLMRRADRALYQAKAAGRNRCRMAPDNEDDSGGMMPSSATA
mgnify:CR=1 FL=1